MAQSPDKSTDSKEPFDIDGTLTEPFKPGRLATKSVEHQADSYESFMKEMDHRYRQLLNRDEDRAKELLDPDGTLTEPFKPDRLTTDEVK